MQGLEPFLASCLSSQYFVTDALEAGVCLTLGTAHLPFQVLERRQYLLELRHGT